MYIYTYNTHMKAEPQPKNVPSLFIGGQHTSAGPFPTRNFSTFMAVLKSGRSATGPLSSAAAGASTAGRAGRGKSEKTRCYSKKSGCPKAPKLSFGALHHL